ncbi:SFII DNA helicase-like protein [Cryptosporidium canis]|uniref:SFII DNA helicase-like protein n=1 Tax=Cryptosporidium canis TaxID=195482 RepID=A0ABQ8P5H7_9CRYT|nr:SFII DNA helicase-like protein [Cryptosporidium canis]KAJ1606582.1 SFII DNA helicase-like protein [Cryptosporidium canis]
MDPEEMELEELQELLERDLGDYRMLDVIQEDDAQMIEDLVLMESGREEDVAAEAGAAGARDSADDTSWIAGDAGILADLIGEEMGDGSERLERPERAVGAVGTVGSCGNSLRSLGVDERLVRYYSEKGLLSLYDWQYECITQPGVLQGRNLVYSAPTSGGKTLVSELLMYRRVLEAGRGALVVFPFVSLVAEKREAYYKAGGEVCGLRVSEFHHGSKSPLSEEFDIGVATIEKANALVNYYIQHGTLFKRLGIIVVDELHLLGDEQRGYILEVMLTKVRLLSRLQGEGGSIQIVGMSATLPNLRDIGLWLDAVVYQSDFRPVPLREHIVINGNAYIKPGKDQDGAGLGASADATLRRVLSWDFRPVDSNLDASVLDVEQVGSSRWRHPLVNMTELLAIGWEALSRGESVLVFCPSKYSVESTAMFFATCCRGQFCEGLNLGEGTDRQRTAQSLRFVERQRLLLAEEIRQNSSLAKRHTPNASCLAECVIRGVGFHHSGLSHIERRIVERGYKNGTLSLLTATSTLAAGVNLPSKRVIFRGINIGRSFLTCVDYKQMSGRAGRAGQRGAFGESFILVNNNSTQGGRGLGEELETALELITADMKPLMSSFFSNSNGLARLILEILAVLSELGLNSTGIRSRGASSSESSPGSILDLLSESTLMHHQIRLYRDISPSRRGTGDGDCLEDALNYLMERSMVARRAARTGQTSIGGYQLNCSCTPLGKAIVSSGLSPAAGLELYEELQKSTELTFFGDLNYLSYLVAPFPPSEVSGGPRTASSSTQPFFRLDWGTLYKSIQEMSVLERHSLVRLGFDLEQISWASQLCEDSLPPRLREPGFLRRHQRLLASQILKSVLAGQPLEQILSRFKFVSARDLQQLHTASLTLCVSCISFCQSMNWTYVQVIFQSCLRHLQAVTLLDEYSGTLARDPGLEKSARKLVSGLEGLSLLPALELRSALSVQTPNQILTIPQRVLAHCINNRVYSGGGASLVLVSDFVECLFRDLRSSKRRLPVYNTSAGLSRASPELIFPSDPPHCDPATSENLNLLNLLGQLETEGFLEADAEHAPSSSGRSRGETTPAPSTRNPDQLDPESDRDILDMLMDDNQESVDWEERLLLWSTPLQQSQDWGDSS